MPKISLIYTDLDLAAKLICFNAKSIQLCNYSENGYLVLPHLVPGQPQTVYFPDFPYTPQFWKNISKLHNYSLTESYPEICLSEVKSYLNDYPFTNATKHIREWGSRSQKFISTLSDYFSPQFLSSIRDITILVTEFGTLGSFSKKKHSDGTFSLICSSRCDFPVSNIFNLIVQGLILCTQSGYNDLGTIGWHQRQALMNYFSTQTKLDQYITNPQPPSIDQQLISQSSTYLSQLGFSPKSNLPKFSLKELLTPHEKSLYDCLLANQGVLVSFDDIATTIWGDRVDEKYSLYAMAKLIENLRKKIRNSGNNRDLVRTFRKRGYMLVG